MKEEEIKEVISAYNTKHKISYHAFQRKGERHITYIPRKLKLEGTRVQASKSIDSCYKILYKGICIIYSVKAHTILTVYRCKKF